jgi:SAM-dependent methyltransferase
MKRIFSRTPPALTPEDVRDLYREHLGREVESDEVLDGHLRGHKTIDSLRQVILTSTEYRSNILGREIWNHLGANLCRPAPPVEVDVGVADFNALFERIADQWSTLGETDAHWSVLTNEKYRALAFPAHAEEFYLTGRHTASLIELFAERNRVELDRSHVLELGCGTGRITATLVESFEKVTAVDISPGHLELCRQAVADTGRSNADFLHLNSPGDAARFPECSFFFSVIVLQHNPPPLADYLLDQALAKVSGGGAALFQIPTHFPGYQFRISEYLQSPMPPAFEMHCLPMDRIFRLLHRHGFTPLEVIMDTWTGLPGSHTFFAVKEPACTPSLTSQV